MVTVVVLVVLSDRSLMQLLVVVATAMDTLGTTVGVTTAGPILTVVMDMIICGDRKKLIGVYNFQFLFF